MTATRLPSATASRRGLWSRWAGGGVLAVGALLAAACSHDHGAASGVCATEMRADAYQAGMVKNGMQSQLSFRLVESQPGPPIKGDNLWMLQLLDGAGKGLSGAQLTVSPFMPDHGHGTSVKAVIEDLGGGSYKLSPVNLFMAGLWVVTISATVPSSSKTDQTTFSFCVEG